MTTRRALLACAIAPLSLVVLVPVCFWISEVAALQLPDWRAIGAVPLALIFGYAGFVIFGIPLVFGVRALKRWPIASVIFVCLVGWFAAVVTPQLLEGVGNRDVAIGNLRTIATTPSFWIGPETFAGAACGLVFWLIASDRRAYFSKIGRAHV